MSEEDEEELRIKPGVVIESGKTKYLVGNLLGQGGYGAVYKVYDQNNKDRQYAMKVEKKIEARVHQKLKMEIAILKAVMNQRKQSHFTEMVDRGKKENFFFIVMELVGKSLHDLKCMQADKVFSISCGLGVSVQCLEACEDLHKYGFIHRDVKPANYACGLNEKKRIIYILDFGIARKVFNDKLELKTPRAKVGFKGTVRFAAISCHKGIELGFKDDCESWFYLMLDLIVKEGLPWKRMPDRNDVLRIKEECRREKKQELFGSLRCKDELWQILAYIDEQKYADRIDFQFIYKMIEEACKVAGGNLNNPYDWE